ncbi:MAG: glycosyltransferase family 4 protein [Desulfobacteraceae bacterium]|jgi:glycosyltransferase involved in cell wall biosynthesis
MNIGFISTRFSGTDGVTLEASKWAQVFTRNGYNCFWFAGELERYPATSYLAPEAHFSDPTNQKINAAIFGQTQRAAQVSALIHTQRRILKKHLYRFVQKYHIEMLVAENVLCLPMHVSLGMALSEFMAETQIPTIAHHHDFYWERERYMHNAVGDYLQMAFPPRLTNIAHTVINSTAREELARRCGISSIIVPNVIDYQNPPVVDRQIARSFRDYVGIGPDEIMILQPTRVVQRKGIEHAINLVKALDRPDRKCKLVISHQAGDEGFDYADWLSDYAHSQAVDLIFVETHLCDPWGADTCRYPQFSLWDVYPGADFVTYPSLYEGFGNGFLEAVYFKRPLLVNRYATFIKDIEPLGFNVVTMDGFLTGEAVAQVNRLLDSKRLRDQVTTHNYNIAWQYFSYEALQTQLNTAMTELFGDRCNRMAVGSETSAASHTHEQEQVEKKLSSKVPWAKAYN